MKIVISPAKTLDFKSKLPTTRATQPPFLETTAKINRKLSRISRRELSELMDISDKLAELNHSRYQEFEEEHTPDNSRPAVYAFAGDVYDGLEAYTIPTGNLDRLQERLRILSGFYGILRPLDLVQPHRLEMGTDLPISRKKNLYDLWREKITSKLNSELEKDELFVNLASGEYFKAVDAKKLQGMMVTPVFKNYKNGTLKVISFFAKTARGAMVRYLIDNDIQSIEGIKAFTTDGYRFNETESTGDELVFTR